MGDREQWVEKQLAREAKGRAKVAEVITETALRELVLELVGYGAQHADVSRRWAAVDGVKEALAAGGRAGFAFRLAHEVQVMFEMGRPIALKSRIVDAAKLRDEWIEKRLRESLKRLEREEATRGKPLKLSKKTRAALDVHAASLLKITALQQGTVKYHASGKAEYVNPYLFVGADGLVHGREATAQDVADFEKVDAAISKLLK
jgi:hypothetical protein